MDETPGDPDRAVMTPVPVTRRRHAKLSRPEHHALCYLAEIGGLVVRNAAIY